MFARKTQTESQSKSLQFKQPTLSKSLIYGLCFSDWAELITAKFHLLAVIWAFTFNLSKKLQKPAIFKK